MGDHMKKLKDYYVYIALALAAAIVFFAALAHAADTPRTPTTTAMPKDAVLYTWAGLDGDDTGVPVDVSTCRQLTAHVYSSTYGSSTITVEGSNATAATTSEWVGLTDPQGNAISKTADGIEAIEEQVRFFRPKTASGTSADVAVGLLCQR